MTVCVTKLQQGERSDSLSWQLSTAVTANLARWGSKITMLMGAHALEQADDAYDPSRIRAAAQPGSFADGGRNESPAMMGL
eukprot:365682-Chlamydomonas_euryale.AAC.25